MSAPLALRARGIAASVVEHIPSTGARALAEPPAGSGLAPVMGEPGVPVVGHTFEVLQDPVRFARRYYERFGTVAWGNLLGTRMAMVLGPDAIETVLAN